MAQPVYPSTLPRPEAEGFVRQPALDPVIRTTLEDGNELVVRTHTFVPWMWVFQYRFLSPADRDVLLSFWEGPANCGAEVIKFTDPTDNLDYFVRFAARPECSLETSQQQQWKVQVHLRQVRGRYT